MQDKRLRVPWVLCLNLSLAKFSCNGNIVRNTVPKDKVGIKRIDDKESLKEWVLK